MGTARNARRAAAVATVYGFLVLQNTIHWIKTISVQAEDGTVISKGHFSPLLPLLLTDL
jgi:hypothetical protein